VLQIMQMSLRYAVGWRHMVRNRAARACQKCARAAPPLLPHGQKERPLANQSGLLSRDYVCSAGAQDATLRLCMDNR
jgi:hypothetical protein